MFCVNFLDKMKVKELKFGLKILGDSVMFLDLSRYSWKFSEIVWGFLEVPDIPQDYLGFFEIPN